jgi:hypothetical protein
MSRYVYLGTKVILSLAAGSVGLMALAEAAGFAGTMVEPVRFNHNGVDKWAAGSAMLGLDVRTFFLFLGLCKFSAFVAFWTNKIFGLEALATGLLAVLYACVVVGHYQVDGDFVPPVFLLTLCVVKLLTAPAARSSGGKSPSSKK